MPRIISSAEKGCFGGGGRAGWVRARRSISDGFERWRVALTKLWLDVADAPARPACDRLALGTLKDAALALRRLLSSTAWMADAPQKARRGGPGVYGGVRTILPGIPPACFAEKARSPSRRATC